MRVQVKVYFLVGSLLESVMMKASKKMSGKKGPPSKTGMMAKPKKKGMPGKGKAKTPMGGKSGPGGKKMGPLMMGK
mgnify:CR=1 FL=1